MKTKLQSRKSKRNYIIVALIVIMLLLGVGYASFSQTLQITGTATGSASWDVHFKSASKTQRNATTGTLETADASSGISSDGHSLTVDVTDLAFPGDAREITAVIENSSSLGAKLTGFTVTDSTGATTLTQNDTNSPIMFDWVALPIDGTEVIAANGGTCTYKFTVKWNPNYVAPDSATSTTTTVNGTYKITFTYEQNTTAPTVTKSHTHNPS